MQRCLDVYRPLSYLRIAQHQPRLRDGSSHLIQAVQSLRIIPSHVKYSIAICRKLSRRDYQLRLLYCHVRHPIRCSFRTRTLTCCTTVIHKERHLVTACPSKEISLAHETTKCKEMNNVDRLHPQIPGHWPRPLASIAPHVAHPPNIHAAGSTWR
jgi:hypothetical protein